MPETLIDARHVYSLDEASRRMGLGTAAIRQARRNGLKIRKLGRRSYVLGEDVIEYLKNHAKIVGPDGTAN